VGERSEVGRPRRAPAQPRRDRRAAPCRAAAATRRRARLCSRRDQPAEPTAPASRRPQARYSAGRRRDRPAVANASSTTASSAVETGRRTRRRAHGSSSTGARSTEARPTAATAQKGSAAEANAALRPADRELEAGQIEGLWLRESDDGLSRGAGRSLRGQRGQVGARLRTLERSGDARKHRDRADQMWRWSRRGADRRTRGRPPGWSKMTTSASTPSPAELGDREGSNSDCPSGIRRAPRGSGDDLGDYGAR